MPSQIVGWEIPPKVLVVDDSAMLLALVHSALTLAGFRVLTESRPLAVPKTAREYRPDLILVDVNMPTMSGERLVKIMKMFSNDVPLVLFSSMPDAQLEAAAQRCGADGYLDKDSGPEDVAKRLVCWFNRRTANSELQGTAPLKLQC